MVGPLVKVGQVNFEPILDELKVLHKEYPSIRLGTFLQQAVDTRKKVPNTNLNDMSTKEILTSVKDFRRMLKEKKVRRPK